MSIISEIDQLSDRQVRVVCFDLGGVLVSVERSWEDAMHAAGFTSVRGGPIASFPGLNDFQKGNLPESEYLDGLAAYLRLEGRSDALRVHNAILRGPYPGTLELIEDLSDRGLTTACLSNTNEPHWKEMGGSGRFPNFEALALRVCSHELHLEKPDPEFYRAFEETASAIGREIVFFDDLEDNVEAARERGWRAYWIDHTADTAEQMELILISENVLPMP